LGGGNNVDGPFVDYRGALTSTVFFIKKCPNDDRGVLKSTLKVRNY
jgi:hypothetical protein